MVSEMFHCVKNQGTSRIFRCVRGLFGFVIQTGKLTRQFAPNVIADDKAKAAMHFAAWRAGTWHVDHPEEMQLIAAQLLEGDLPSVPVAGTPIKYRVKTGVYTERHSDGYEPTSEQDADDKFYAWLQGQWDADIPDAEERDVYRDRPFDGVQS